MRFLLFCIAIVTTWPLAASADVLSPPPPSCPRGSIPMACHGAPTCTADACVDDADCAPSQHCAVLQLCVQEHCCSGRACGDPGAPRFTHVDGPCGSTGCADSSSTCMPVSVCVPDEDAGGGDVDSGAADEDSGAAEMDSGAAGTDSGSAAIDARVDTDSGSGGPSTGGGCCTVIGARRSAAAALAIAVALALTIGRRRRD
jgi:hypothetical protein